MVRLINFKGNSMHQYLLLFFFFFKSRILSCYFLKKKSVLKFSALKITEEKINYANS